MNQDGARAAGDGGRDPAIGYIQIRVVERGFVSYSNRGSDEGPSPELVRQAKPGQQIFVADGDFEFQVAFYFDRLSALMTLIVTGVGSLIHVYSTGYMKDDASYARYFAYLNLFLFFMLLLVLGRSLLVLFVGWEGVGLASYLLIGFWFEDPEKAAAGKKAFIVNRIGDFGFLLAMLKPAIEKEVHKEFDKRFGNPKA